MATNNKYDGPDRRQYMDFTQQFDSLKELFNTKFDNLASKLDDIKTSHDNDYKELREEVKVELADVKSSVKDVNERVTTAETNLSDHQKTHQVAKFSFRNEVLSTIIRWGIPLLIILILYEISNGTILRVIGIGE